MLVLLVLVVMAGCSSVPSGSAGDLSAPSGWQATPPIHVVQGVSPAAVSGYNPSQVWHAYGFDTLASKGAGQTIAVIDAYGSPTIQNDLNTFSTEFGLPTTTVQIAYPAGSVRQVNGGWALETALDVEWAHAIAPGATILLVVSPNDSFTSLLACVDYGATHAAQVSMSWGGAEFRGETGYDSNFNKPQVTFTAASGDSGGGAEWPASSPYVISVGGTTLSLGSTGNVLQETAWSGSNGGPSAYESEPAYQTQWQSSGKREMPDVSYDANPSTGVAVYTSTAYDGQKGWFEVGGTSVGTPQWAAACALANASRATPLNYTNNPVYALGSPSTFTQYFRDITVGSNDRYKAGTGYDMVTGLGSPLAASLVPGLVAQ
jgi:subtilase family serine protease